MRAVVLTDQGLELQTDRRRPTPGQGEALLRVQLAGICSTDLELVKGYFGFRGVLGHEFVGTVQQSDAPSWEGCRVVCAINFADPCSAEFLQFGREHHPGRKVLGILGHDGAMADHVCVPQDSLHAVPDDVTDEEAVFAEPLAAALRIAEQLALRPSGPAAVVGPGRLGMLVGQVLAARGASVWMLGRRPESLQLAEQLGLQTALVDDVPAYDFPLVVECTGSPAGLQQAIRITRPCGQLVLKSTYAGQASVDLTPVVVNEISVVGSRCGPMAPALRCLQRRQVAVLPLIDARYEITEALAAFAHAASPGVRKVLLRVS